MQKRYFILLLVFFWMMLLSCGEGGDGQKDQPTSNGQTTSTVDLNKALQKLSTDFALLRAIPSPIEMASVVQESGARYNPAILHDDEKAKSYNTDFKRALNLGVYSTDLGFANLYKKNQDAIDYLVAIRDLSKGLKIDSYFDFERLRKLTDSNADIQELLTETLTSLQNVKDGLEKENRGDVTILIVTGGWIEALYLGCYIADNAPNKQKLLEYLADQRLSLDNLVKLLADVVEVTPEAKKLYDHMKELSGLYQGVSLEVESTTKTQQIDGVPSVVQEEQSVKLNFTPQQFQQIYNKVKEIRQHIT